MTNVCVIPARGGSRRIPRKNIREFHGKPIIAYSIETARFSSMFDFIFVSTDDDEIAAVAKKYGAVVLRRAADMARDVVGTQEVMRDALESIHTNWCPMKVDLACCLYPCAPLVLPTDLRSAFDGEGYGVAVGGDPLRDAGAFYCGRASQFLSGEPLYSASTRLIVLPEKRVRDINTEDDWAAAEDLYARLTGGTVFRDCTAGTGIQLGART